MRLLDPKKTVQYVSGVVIFALAILIVLFLQFSPWFVQLDRATYDFVFRVRPHLQPSNEICVIAMDEPSQSQPELGILPWKRGIHARFLRELKKAGARGAVFDVLFDRPREDDPEGDAEFAKAIQEFGGNVVLGREVSVTSDPQYQLEIVIDPIPSLLEAGATPGFVSTPPDIDTRIRRSNWLVKGESTLATEALRRFKGQTVREADGRIFIDSTEVPAVYDMAGTPSFTINYAGPAHTIPTRSYYQVLDGTLPAGFLKDKIVFVGADVAAENRTGGPATDRFPTPVDENVLMPGVEIHANAFNTILSRAFVRTASLRVQWSLLLFFAVITTVFSIAFRPLTAGIATGVTAVLSGLAVYLILAHYDYWLPSVAPVALITLIYGGNTLAQYRVALKERAQIQSAFKHYVSAEVLGELMKNPDNLGLGGREVEATVLFTDIAGFSKLSEKITPQELTQMLNQYFELLAGVIMKEGGMVNKFIGDAVMAIWGAPLDNPDHAVQACRASLQMHRAMLVMDPIRCRIGINTGRMIAGNMGSKQRFEYTVIGDAVNLASRLEGVNKPYHTDIMISEMTEEKIRGHFLHREVDSIRVVGKLEPVRIYQLLDEMTNKGAPEFDRWQEMIASYMPALETYRMRKWEEALPMFQHHVVLFPEDPVGAIYVDRCRTFCSAPPPDDWDGVYQMETK